MCATTRVEKTSVAKDVVLSAFVAKKLFVLVDRVGLEPTIPRLKGECLDPTWPPVGRANACGRNSRLHWKDLFGRSPIGAAGATVGELVNCRSCTSVLMNRLALVNERDLFLHSVTKCVNYLGKLVRFVETILTLRCCIHFEVQLYLVIA